MSDSTAVVVGVDVAASRPSVAAALRGSRRGLELLAWREADEREPGDRGRMLEWIAELAPSVVAVAAAQRPRRMGGAAPGPARHADTELLRRRIAVAPTPTRAQAEAGGPRAAHAMAGWAYFKDLRRLGFEPLAPGALAGALGRSAALVEVYPHASFVSLLGGTPPPRATRVGLHLRLLTLRALGVRWDEYFDAASLDALMAAYTAWKVVQGLAIGLGDERDGCVWLPVTAHELRETYSPLTFAETRAAAERLAAH